MKIYKGTIRGFRGSWGSGLGYLIIDDDERGRVSVPCDNAPTVRALEGCFGNVISKAHTVNPRGGHVGKKVYYSLDDFGIILEGFSPVRGASPELKKLFKDERAARDN